MLGPPATPFHRRTGRTCTHCATERGSVSPMGSSFPPGDRREPYVGIHAVNVYVRDQDRSLKFYVDQLGFHVAFDARVHSGDRWVAVAPPDGSAVLALIAPKPESKQDQPIGR